MSTTLTPRRPNRSSAVARSALSAIVLCLATACNATEPTPASRLTVLPRPTTTATTVATPTTSAPIADATATTRPRPPAASSTPTLPPTPRPPRLVIPEIKLDAEIVDVPIVDNAWNVDDLGQKVGWLAGTGTAPGDDYAPVLAAHVADGFGISGPFGYLWSLSLGGTVELDFGDQRYTYEVIDRRKAQPQDVAKVLIPDGNRLVLLTCEGWDLTRLDWNERLLVIAELRETTSRP